MKTHALHLKQVSHIVGFEPFGYNQRWVFFADTGKGGGAAPEDPEEKKKREEEEKKKKEEEDKKKTEKEKEEEEKKKREEEEKKKKESEEVDITASDFQKRAEKAIESAKGVDEGMKLGNSKEQKENAEKMYALKGDFERLNAEDQAISKPAKAFLDELVARKKITREEAQRLFDIDLNDPHGNEKWEKLVGGMPGLTADKAAFERLKELKFDEGLKRQKIEEEFARKLRELRLLSEEAAKMLKAIAVEEIMMKRYNRRVGLPIEKDKSLVYKNIRKKATADGTGEELETYKEFITVREVVSEEVDITDEKGNVTGKMKTGNPIFTIESQGPDGTMKKDLMTNSEFEKFIENHDITEDLNSQSDLEKSIGMKIAKGDKLEYRFVDEVADSAKANEQLRRTMGKDMLVEVKEINEHDPEKQVVLDQEVVTGGGRKQKNFTFGEFAKWYKRNEAMKPIGDLKDLQRELDVFNQVQNQIYNRDPKSYPKINVEAKEMLYYNDGSERTFRIKEVDEKTKKVIFESGEALSFASFLRWVKKNEVEKRTPDAMANLATAHIEDPVEKEKIAQQVKEDIETADAAKEKADAKLQQETGKKPDHHSVDEESGPTAGYWKKLYRRTHLMSISDFLEMGKTLTEFVKRKWHRHQHGKIGAVGESMFGPIVLEIGAEFKGVGQHAENEEVNHHVHHYETMGIETVKHELHGAPNTDILKAAVTVLAKKGQLRWDDHAFWDRVNILSGGVPVMVRGPTHMEDLEKVFDKWWGQDTFREFKNSAESSYNSLKSNFKDNASRLEIVPGGLKKKLKHLLWQHLSTDQPVHPAEYEQYIHYAIDEGKMGFYDKPFFLMMGVALEANDPHGHGMTLLHLDRVGTINSSTNKFPILDYFTQGKFPKVDANGKILSWEDKDKVSKAEIGHFKMWFNEMMAKDLADEGITDIHNIPPDKIDKLGPGRRFKEFIEQEVMWSPATRTRINKASRDATNWDHDDMDFFAPMLGEESIDKITRFAGNARQQVSTPGLLNAAMGLNATTRIKMDMLNNHLKDPKKTSEQRTQESRQDVRDIIDVMRSYVRFHAIIDTRFKHTAEGFVRLGPAELREAPLNDDSRATAIHLEEMKNFVRGLSRELGLEKEFNEVYKKYPGKVSGEIQNKQESAVLEFGKQLEGAILRYASTSKNEVDPNKVKELFNKAGQEDVLGRAGKKKEKKQGEETDPLISDLLPYKDEEVESRVQRIGELIEKIKEANNNQKTSQQVKDEQAKRLAEIQEEVASRKYKPTMGDIKVLDAKISELQNQLNTLETPTDMRGGKRA